MCSSSSASARAALVDPFAQLGDQERDIGGDLGLPGGLESRGRQLALPGAEVEPRGADLGAVERDQRVAPFDLLPKHDMDLAHDAGGAGTDLDLPVRVDLDHPDDGDPGRDAVEPRRLDRDLGLLELGLRQRDARAAGCRLRFGVCLRRRDRCSRRRRVGMSEARRRPHDRAGPPGTTPIPAQGSARLIDFLLD